MHTLDLAKRLLDYGFYAPTIYFPLVVPGAIMIEPTETESKQTIDEFIAAIETIVTEARDTPDLVKEAPHGTFIGRLDETRAARRPILRWQARANERSRVPSSWRGGSNGQMRGAKIERRRSELRRQPSAEHRSDEAVSAAAHSSATLRRLSMRPGAPPAPG